MTNGKQIRTIRLKQDISAAELAKKLKITDKHLRRVERGDVPLSPGLAADVAKLLKGARTKRASKKSA